MKKILLFIFVGICVGGGLSLLTAEMIEHTSGVEFCSSCHSMKGPALAYKESVHGGNNQYGVRAQCADCHLPHDSVTHYLVAKAFTGARDVLGEMFWADSFDWVGNLKKRQDFTYTTGCQKCHDLDAIHYRIPKAYLGHKDFKMGVVTSCVQCHEHVGHKDIQTYFTKTNL